MLKDNNIIFINFHNRIPICFIKMIKIIYFLVCNCNFDYFVLTWCFLKNISIVFVCYWFFTWFFIIAARNIHKSIFIYIFKMFLNLILILNLTQMLSKCGFFAWIMPIFRVFVLKKFPFASWFMFKKMLKSFKNIYPWQFFCNFQPQFWPNHTHFSFIIGIIKDCLIYLFCMTNLCFCEYIMKKFS